MPTVEVIHRGKLKQIEFTFALGDLFDAEVDAIVNSEQTDFILSRNPKSISGQIRRRYGDAVQRELNQLGKGQALRAGIVLDTSGGKDFKRIFHAGFHEPLDWPGMQGSSQDADYFEAIGSCIRQVLDAARTLKLSSVAFPLIGCGLFGLDEKMLILQFMDAIESLDGRLKDGEKLNVWLIIHNPAQFKSITGKILELLLAARRDMVAIHVSPTGIPILDRFAAHLSQRSNEDWAKWQLCRFTEIALEIMCCSLGLGVSPPVTPELHFVEGESPTFGRIRELALKCALAPPVKMNVWGRGFFANVMKDQTAVRALEEINAQRNNLAHGRKSRALAEIEELLSQSLQLGAWVKITESDGELRLVDWKPWVMRAPTTNDQIGVFERWQKNATRYLIPETGEIFKIPRA